MTDIPNSCFISIYLAVVPTAKIGDRWNKWPQKRCGLSNVGCAKWAVRSELCKVDCINQYTCQFIPGIMLVCRAIYLVY